MFKYINKVISIICKNRTNNIKVSKNEPWMIELVKCQEEVQKYNQHPHYKNRYRQEEAYYWHKVAEWLYEDSLKYKYNNILDIGCAYGTLSVFANRIFNCNSYCIDFMEEYFSAKLQNKYSLNFKVCNIELEDISWKERFDAILLTEVIEHFNFNPIPTMLKIKKLLVPGGRLYISTPDASRWGRLSHYNTFKDMPSPQCGIPIIDDHVYQYLVEEIEELADLTGFMVERSSFSVGVKYRHISMTLISKSNDC